MIIREPSWMASLAKLAGQRVVCAEKLTKLVFGLCRMEALRVRDQVGTILSQPLCLCKE